MASKFRSFVDILVEAGNDFADDHATKLAASLAYYTLFSIGPLLLVIITILGVFYKQADVTSQVFEQLSEVTGPTVAAQAKSILSNLSLQNNNTLFGIIGALVFVFGATGIFTEIQSSINYVWSIRAKPKRSWLKYLVDRLLSFVLILGLGVVMMASLLLNLVMDMIAGRLSALKHLPKFMGEIDLVLVNGFNIGILYVIVTVLFAIVFKVLPDAKIYWRDALIGAAFTGVLFLIGKFLITYYFSISKSFSVYGAATSIILMLSWIYYSAMILYFGAEFTKVYAMKWGKGITVSPRAVYIIKREARELPGLVHPVQEN